MDAMIAAGRASGSVKRFGRVEFDTARGRLLVDGRRMTLDRSSAGILTLLLLEAGESVDKDRLLEAGWPGRVVHENSLAKAIGRLRQALGEDGVALETVHGYGYRIDADVRDDVWTEPDSSSPARRLRMPGLALSGLALAAVAALWMVDSPGETETSSESVLMRGEAADALGRVLWVDDHPENNADEKQFFEERGIAVYQVTSTEEALALLAMYEYGAVISDMNRDGRPLAGLELVQEMRGRDDRTPFFLYTVVPSTAQRRLITEAGGQGATVTPDQLYAAILPLFQDRRGERGR